MDRGTWKAIVHGVTKSQTYYKILAIFPVKSESISCSVMSDPATPWTVAHQAPLSMGFSRQEYWSGLPFTSPGDRLNQGIEHIACIGRKILYH